MEYVTPIIIKNTIKLITTMNATIFKVLVAVLKP